MRRILLMLLALCGPIRMAAAAPTIAPGMLCRQAAEMAARVHGIPPSLMAAIGQVESGRRDPDGIGILPWPWTVNAGGEGMFYDTKQAAIDAVRALQGRGVRSIDVGCMQVNLLHHPNAFPDLTQAFDPAANADYAARFLKGLYWQTGAWPKAAAMYHSATPELAADYQRKVMAIWTDGPRLGGTTQSLGAAIAMPLRPFGFSVSRAVIAGRTMPFVRHPSQGGRDLAAYRAAPVMVRTTVVAPARR